MKIKSLRIELVALVLSLMLMAIGPVVDSSPYQQLESKEDSPTLDRSAVAHESSSEIAIEEESGESMVLDNG